MTKTQYKDIYSASNKKLTKTDSKLISFLAKETKELKLEIKNGQRAIGGLKDQPYMREFIVNELNMKRSKVAKNASIITKILEANNNYITVKVIKKEAKRIALDFKKVDSFLVNPETREKSLQSFIRKNKSKNLNLLIPEVKRELHAL